VRFFKDQKGFSALSLFFMGLGLIILMSATGFFTHPKSPVTDTTEYTATGSKNIDNVKGLHMVDLDFSTPTQMPESPITTVPPNPIPSICTPPPGNYCEHETERNGCTCNPCLPVGLYCNGNLPPAPATCTGDTPACQSQASQNPSCHFYCLGKPVIYLYPTHSMFVDVTLGRPETLVESIPEYGNGWKNVLALPGGILKYQNNYFRELYYESSVEKVMAPDNGIFIKAGNLNTELKTKTEELGLNSYESEEFVEYWTPRLEALNKPYIFFSIISKEEKEKTDHVDISPKPDTFIQFIAYFKGVDAPFETKPFTPPNVPERTGFTAVEWGGVIEPSFAQ
jgi:hypothetical protein